MALRKKYNFPDHVTGSTFNKKGFRIVVNTLPKVLTGASILMQLRLTPTDDPVLTLTETDGITIDAVVTNRFEIDEQVISVPANTYLYDIEITFPDTTIKSWIYGYWKILPRISHV